MPNVLPQEDIWYSSARCSSQIRHRVHAHMPPRGKIGPRFSCSQFISFPLALDLAQTLTLSIVVIRLYIPLLSRPPLS